MMEENIPPEWVSSSILYLQYKQFRPKQSVLLNFMLYLLARESIYHAAAVAVVILHWYKNLVFSAFQAEDQKFSNNLPDLVAH